MSQVDESFTTAAAWDTEGRRIGASLDTEAAVVVVSALPDDAASVALGIGAVQAARRRVVVVDLAGDTPALAALAGGDDPHGLSDSFRYGVSLNRVAHPIGEGGNLFVIASGTEPVVDEEIYRNDRWRRLVAGFREVGALMVLVAPADAPALDALTGYVDGVVAVGEVAAPGRVIATATAPRLVPAAARVRRSSFNGRRFGETPRESATVPPRRTRRAFIVAGGVAAAVIAGVIVFRASAASREPVAAAAVADTLAAAGSRSIDSASAAVAPDTPPVRNPGDSARAATWAVEIAKFSTPTGALLRVREELPRNAPGATFGVVAIGADATLWYRVIAGAASSRAGADSTLGALRVAKAIDDPAAGAVVSAPFAFRLQSDVAPASSASVAAEYLARGVPAYALLQEDGTATIYAGAFETADQAALFMAYLRAAGIEPALTYRIGRTP